MHPLSAQIFVLQHEKKPQERKKDISYTQFFAIVNWFLIRLLVFTSDKYLYQILVIWSNGVNLGKFRCLSSNYWRLVLLVNTSEDGKYASPNSQWKHHELQHWRQKLEHIDAYFHSQCPLAGWIAIKSAICDRIADN